MPSTAETDIQELKDLVLGLREEMRTGFLEIKGELKTLDQKFSVKIKSLDKKVSSLDEMLKIQDVILDP